MSAYRTQEGGDVDATDIVNVLYVREGFGAVLSVCFFGTG